MRYHNEPNLAPTRVKRQHTLPRVLLRGFTVAGKIVALDLETEETFVSSIENVAVEKGFYDLVSGGQNLSIETWLGELESRASSVLDMLRTRPEKLLSLTAREEDSLARFMCAQMFRGPAMVRMIDGMRSQMVEQAKDVTLRMLERELGKDRAKRAWDLSFADEPDHYWLTEQREISSSESVAVTLAEVQGFANTLCAMPWYIANATPGLTFYTSDNGFARAPYPSAVWPVFFEWFNIIPLSSRQVFIAGPGLIQDDKAPCIVDLPPWGTVRINRFITAGADRFIYGSGPFLNRAGVVVEAPDL